MYVPVSQMFPQMRTSLVCQPSFFSPFCTAPAFHFSSPVPAGFFILFFFCSDLGSLVLKPPLHDHLFFTLNASFGPPDTPYLFRGPRPFRSFSVCHRTIFGHNFFITHLPAFRKGQQDVSFDCCFGSVFSDPFSSTHAISLRYIARLILLASQNVSLQFLSQTSPPLYSSD